MHKLKVAELKKRCEIAGLPTTGTKKILIDRLEFYSAHNTLDNNLRTRLNELETTVARLTAQGTAGNDSVDSEEPSPALSPPRTIAFAPQAISSPCPEAVAVTAVQTPMPSQQIGPTQGVEGVRPRYTAANSAPLYVPTGGVPQYVSAANTRQYIPASNTHQGYVNNGNGYAYYPGGVPQVTPSTFMAGYAGGVPSMVPISAPIGVQGFVNPAMVVQPNVGLQSTSYANTPFTNVKDMVAILPDFDPTDERSLTASQFVQRVQMLKTAYQWRDDILIFAIQQKLQGHAKMWINSQCEIFSTWSQFVTKFTQAFPFQINSADAHLKMAAEKRKAHETPQAYYYKMVALGGKFGLAENAIARHIINGINDADLRKKISNDYMLCVDLLKDIDAYCCFNEIKTNNVKPVAIHETPMTKLKPVYNVQPNNKHIKCYNCSKYGHIAPKCPEPRKTERSKVVPNRVNKVDTGCEAKAEITKKILINGRSLEALVDPGSARTLIRASIANKLGPSTRCSVALNGFGGGQYVCSKQLSTVVLIDGHKLQVECLLVDDTLLGHDVLVGRDLLCQQGKRIIIQNDDCWMEKAEQIAAKTTDLQPNEECKLKIVLNSNRNCFAETVFELGTCTVAKMDIKLTSAEPICKKPYRIEFSKRPRVQAIIQELLCAKIIRVSESPYASPVVIVPKKNDELRLCVDYRMLNKITEKQPFPMPVIDEHLARLAGYKYFTIMDLRMGYHQVEIEEHAKKYTAFVTDQGHFEYNRMPFGLVNAPAVFQTIMNTIAAKMERDEILTYLDDVIIPSKTVDEGITRLEKFLKILQDAGLTLRLDKCKFLAQKITYLGHEISENGVTPGEQKLTAVKNFPKPTNVTEVRRFLGLTGFFRKFIRDYAIMTRPLTELLKKIEGTEFRWGTPQQQAFDALIDALCTKPVLALYNFDEWHEVHTDACKQGIAGVVLQSPDQKEWRPVFYYSRQCSDAESVYHSYELEVLAAVETLTRFRIYLLGKPFKLVTDCSALAKAKEKKELLPKIARWYLRLMEFDFEAIHRPAQRLAHADALSRAPDEPATEPDPAGFVLNVSVGDPDWLLSMQLQDEQLAKIIAILQGKATSDQVTQLQADYKLHNSRLYRKVGELKFVVPKSVRWRIVKLCHDDAGHFGVEKTLARIRTHFWFDKMRKYVRNYIASCADCCYYKARGGKPEGEMYIADVEPLPFVTLHVDHLGPFTRSARGMHYVLAFSDAFTKYLIVKAVRSTKTSPVITALNEISSFFGLPRRLVTDRGTAFTSRAFEDYCVRNSIQHIKTAVRTPRANGQVERANQLILNALRTMTEKSGNWDLKLTDIQWIVNSQVNGTTKFTPNELLFDFCMRDVVHNKILAAVQMDQPEVETKLSIGEKRQCAATNISEERTRWKERFDRKHQTPTKYKVGDLVVVAHEPPATGGSRKLEPKYRGPYQIAKVLHNDRYVVTDIPGMQITQRAFDSVYASDKIKPWCGSCPILDDYDSDDDSSLEDDSQAGVAEMSKEK